MKKLKLTINGEVKTFNLPENGEYKCEVEEHYVPKVGDCVRVDLVGQGCATFFKIESIDDEGKINSEHRIDLYKGEYTIILGDYSFLRETNFTQITPEELKAKYAEAGYDWDYETNEVKELKWMPKGGDLVWGLDTFYDPVRVIFDNQFERLRLMAERGFLFQTEEKCKEFSEHCLKYFDKK